MAFCLAKEAKHAQDEHWRSRMAGTKLSCGKPDTSESYEERRASGLPPMWLMQSPADSRSRGIVFALTWPVPRLQVVVVRGMAKLRETVARPHTCTERAQGAIWHVTRRSERTVAASKTSRSATMFCETFIAGRIAIKRVSVQGDMS